MVDKTIPLNNPWFQEIRHLTEAAGEARQAEKAALMSSKHSVRKVGKCTVISHTGAEYDAAVERTIAADCRVVEAVTRLNLTRAQCDAWFEGIFSGNEFEAIVAAGWTPKQADPVARPLEVAR